MNSAKVDLTLQDAHRNTALHLACSKVTVARAGSRFPRHLMNDGCLYLTFCHMLLLTSYPSDRLIGSQGHETCALLILEKIRDRNLINCTNAALQT